MSENNEAIKIKGKKVPSSKKIILGNIHNVTEIFICCEVEFYTQKDYDSHNGKYHGWKPKWELR